MGTYSCENAIDQSRFVSGSWHVTANLGEYYGKSCSSQKRRFTTHVWPGDKKASRAVIAYLNIVGDIGRRRNEQRVAQTFNMEERGATVCHMNDRLCHSSLDGE